MKHNVSASVCDSDKHRIIFGNSTLKFSSLILSVFVSSWVIDVISNDCVYRDFVLFVVLN